MVTVGGRFMGRRQATYSVWTSRAPIQDKMSSYRYRTSHHGDEMIVRSSCLHNGIYYTGKMVSSYWINPQNVILNWKVIGGSLSDISSCLVLGCNTKTCTWYFCVNLHVIFTKIQFHSAFAGAEDTSYQYVSTHWSTFTYCAFLENIALQNHNH